MFRNANAIARSFTRPVIMSRMTVAGDCSANAGAFVVVNDEGWIVTAGHILDLILEMNREEQKFLAHQANEKTIRADASLDEKARRKQLQALGKLPSAGTARASAWFAEVGDGVEHITRVAAIDLGVARLTNFDKSAIPQYPKFKSDGPDFIPGASLCKLGYPFYQGRPTWDPALGAFTYPAGALNACCFPIDGIFTRLQQVIAEDAAGKPIASPFPLEFLETSTPGLKGQSGGPIFDVEGNVWALQCLTAHAPLGFSPPVEVNGKKTVEHQFINMGMGPSAKSITGVLTDLGVKFDTSP